MITLALAQMLFFFYLQAPFTGGEDGIQAVPRGKLFGADRPLERMGDVFLVLAIFLGGLPRSSTASSTRPSARC